MNFSGIPNGKTEFSQIQDKRVPTGLSYNSMRCHFNSLLQSLYRIPEFRRALYSCAYDREAHGRKNKNLLFNLQLLFAQMQTSNTSYVNTNELTDLIRPRFPGNTNSLDLIALFNYLVDGIETNLKGTPLQNKIYSLFRSTITESYECLNCSNIGSKSRSFLHLSLKTFDETQNFYNDSLEKCLSYYGRWKEVPEQQKYHCIHCKTYSSASKVSSVFETFPDVLFLTFEQMNPNSPVGNANNGELKYFPYILNLNGFISGFRGGNSHEFSSQDSKEYLKQNSRINSEEEVIGNIGNSFLLSSSVQNFLPHDIDYRHLEILTNSDCQPICDDWDKQSLEMDKIVRERSSQIETQNLRRKREIMKEAYLSQGENVYELFSVIFYRTDNQRTCYAYINNFEDSSWYKFNDTVVTSLDLSEISDACRDFSNLRTVDRAFAVMYRKVKIENDCYILESPIPAYIKDEQEELMNPNRIKAIEKMNKKKLINLKISFQNESKTIKARKDESLGRLKELVIELFKLQHLQSHDIRLLSLSYFHDAVQGICQEDLSLVKQGIRDNNLLGIEIKEPGTDWPRYNVNEICVKINLWNPSLSQDTRSFRDKTGSPRNFILDKNKSVKSMLQIFQDKLGIPIEEMIVIKCPYLYNTTCEIVNTASNMKLSLTNARIYQSTVLYIEEKQKTTASRWKLLFEKESSRYSIKFNHPDHHTSNTDFSLSVIVDCNSTLEILKKRIARKIRIPLDNFIMIKGSKHGQEYQNINLTLTQANIQKNSLIYIDRF